MRIVRIRVGISSCLLGYRTRYDGGHQWHPVINNVLCRYLEFEPVCPEVAIGMGVPRAPIRLEGESEHLQAIVVEDPDMDVTAALEEYGCSMAHTRGRLSGFILKQRSPSCGVGKVKIYTSNDIMSGDGSGIFAHALMESNPLLPVVVAEDLDDPFLQEEFLRRVRSYHQLP